MTTFIKHIDSDWHNKILHINFQILFNTKIDQTKEVFLITTMQERSFLSIEGQEYSILAKKAAKIYVKKKEWE